MSNDYNNVYEECKNHMHSYVLVEMIDGAKVDGIITGVDEEYVYIAVPREEEQPMPVAHHQQHMNRQYGYPGYGYGSGYGYPGYGYGPGVRPRFRRLVLPLAALTALSILPWY